MDYHKFTLEDFVLDKKFRQWVLTPDQEINLFWEHWINQYPEKVELLKEARTLLLQLPENKHLLHDEEENQLWELIDARITREEAAPETVRKVIPLNAAAILHRRQTKKKFFRSYSQTSKWVASILLLLSIGLACYVAYYNQQSATPPEMITKENPWGQRSTIYLSDGTEVLLNAGSQLRYYQEFTPRDRVVELQGEAFFKVAKDASRPFKVKTGDVITRAVGTSFNVLAYHPENVEVSLVTGKVAVRHQDTISGADSVFLEPGESAGYDSKTGLTKSHFDPKKVLSWKEGIIYFDHADEKTVFNTLEKWYGVKISRVNKTAKSWNYTASFDNRSLEHVLMSISFAMDFQYKMNQKSVTIQYN